VGLVIGEDAHEDRWAEGDARFARRMNQGLVMHARQAVFHHPSDDPVKEISLPPPYRRKTSVEQGLADLVSDTAT
jgi:hypothetical protein